MEPVFDKHKLVVAKVLATKNDRFAEQLPIKEVNRYGLFNALACITKDKGSFVNDERIDAVALSVHNGTNQMGLDFKRERRSMPAGCDGQGHAEVPAPRAKGHAPEVDTDREARAREQLKRVTEADAIGIVRQKH